MTKNQPSDPRPYDASSNGDQVPYQPYNTTSYDETDIFGDPVNPWSSPSNMPTGYYGGYQSHWGAPLGCGIQFLICLAVVLIGNFLVHLYCQNWQIVDHARGHIGAPSIVLVGVLAMAVAFWRDYHALSIPPANVIIPSLIGGMMAVVAFFIGLPGIEQWMPGHNNERLLGDFELLALPVATVWQIYLLGRWYFWERGPW